jgi:hypothetical protein
MADVLSALVRSRKAWVLLLAVVGVVAMNLAGRIDGAQALDFVKWLVSAWFGAVALEDAAHKLPMTPPGSEKGESES